MADAEQSEAADGPAGARETGHLRVGEWSIRLDTRMATGPDGASQRLTPKNLAVLQALAARVGETISKDELLAENWPGRWPTEQVLARCIADLRRLFGDDPRAPRYIETIPKLGYRLIADCSSSAEPQSTVSGSPPEAARDGESGASKTPNRWQRWLAVAIVLAAAAAMLASHLDQRETRPIEDANSPAPPRDLLPETSGAGIETAIDYAADGAMAYARTLPAADAWSIVLTDAERKATRVIDYAPDSVFAPVFSPAADRLALLRFSGDACSVNVMPLDTLNPHPIARCTARFYTTLDWSPSGEWVAYTTDQTADEAGRRALHLVDARTGEKRRLTAPPTTGETDYTPRFSPDGKTVAFMRGTMSPRHRVDLFLAQVDTGETSRLTFDEARMGGLDWLSTDEIAFSSNRDGSWALWVLDRRESTLRRLAGLRARRPVLDATRGVLAFTMSDWDRDIERIELLTDAPPTAIADSTRQDWQPDVSADGETLVFVSNRSGHDEVWRATGTLSDAEQLTDLGGPAAAWPRLSPDGGRIAIAIGDSEPQVSLWSRENGLAALPHPWTATTTPVWAVDGGTLAIGCQVDGRWRICRITPDGKDTAVLTAEDTYHPQYSVDGRWLYYVDSSAALWRQPVGGGAAELVHPSLPSQSISAWRPGGDGVYLLHAGDETRAPGVYRLGPSADELELVRSVVAETVNASLAIDNDGRAYVAVNRQSTDDILSLPLPERDPTQQ